MKRLVPNIVAAKLIYDKNGDPIYLANDHQGAIEDNFLLDTTKIGRVFERSGTNLIDILNHIVDEAIYGENRIDTISVNGTKKPIDSQKNVDITVPTKLNQLEEDDLHSTVRVTEKNYWNLKQDEVKFQCYNYDPVTNRAITKSDLDDAIKPFAGCKRWRGIVNDLSEITDPKNGDECAIGDKEYSYCVNPGDTTGTWREYGSEGTHIHHGEVVNSDIKADAAIEQSKISNLVSDLASKVTAEVGKSLVLDSEIAKIHSHDNKAALDEITKVVWDSIVEKSNQVPDKVDKTTQLAGVQIQTGITKEQLLAAVNVEDGAQVNKIEVVKFNNTEATITDKEISLEESDPVFTTWKNGKIITAGENTSGTEGCIAIGLGAKTEDWGTAVGVNSFARCGLALGPDAKAGTSGDAENLAAIAIGRYSQATKKNSIAIGGNDPSNTAKANAVGAVQIAIGTNNTENSLQFKDTQIVNSDGKIVSANLDIDIDQKISDAISSIIYEDAQGGHIKISDNYTLNISPTGVITATYPTV